MFLRSLEVGVMSGSTIVRPSDTAGRVGTLAEYLQHLTPWQFQQLGVQTVAYLRPCVVDGEEGWAIHTADGALRSVVDDINAAIALTTRWGMAVVTVQ